MSQVIREILSGDQDNRLSSGRIICMMAMIVGSVAFLAQVFGIGECNADYSVTLSILFGGALASKAAAKKFEKSG